MSNFTPTPSLDDVPMYLESTRLLGGDESAPMNVALQALLNRIEHHKQNGEVDPHGMSAAIAAAIAAALAGTPRLDENNTWDKAQRGAFTALTSASGSIAVDLDSSNNFSHTLTENTTLAAPTHAVAGQSGIIEFTQHASSPKTLSLDAFWRFPGGAPSPVLTATNGAIDVMTYVVASTGTYAICSIGKEVS